MKRLVIGICVLFMACDEAEQAGIYDPRTFGAVVDDGADDSPAIQAAVNRAWFAGGGVVVLARGTYTLAHPVGLRGSVTLRGAGVDVTTITRPTGETTLFVVDAPSNNQLIEDLTLDGGPIGNAPLFHAATAWRHSEISRVKFVNYRFAIRLSSYEISRLNRLEMRTPDTFGWAIQVGENAAAPVGANLSIVDTLIRGSGVGLLILDADAVFMRNTDIASSHIDLLIQPSTRSNHHTFADNFFDESGYAGVVLTGNGLKGQILFSGNWIASNPFGFMVQNTPGTVVDLSITGGRVFNHTAQGMLIDKVVNGLLVQGVQFSGCQGLVLTPNARGSQADLGGNQFRECGGVVRQ